MTNPELLPPNPEQASVEPSAEVVNQPLTPGEMSEVVDAWMRKQAEVEDPVYDPEGKPSSQILGSYIGNTIEARTENGQGIGDIVQEMSQPGWLRDQISYGGIRPWEEKQAADLVRTLARANRHPDAAREMVRKSREKLEAEEAAAEREAEQAEADAEVERLRKLVSEIHVSSGRKDAQEAGPQDERLAALHAKADEIRQHAMTREESKALQKEYFSLVPAAQAGDEQALTRRRQIKEQEHSSSIQTENPHDIIDLMHILGIDKADIGRFQQAIAREQAKSDDIRTYATTFSRDSQGRIQVGLLGVFH